jgi:hypothetical protein
VPIGHAEEMAFLHMRGARQVARVTEGKDAMTVEPRTEAGERLLSDLREQRVATVDDSGPPHRGNRVRGEGCALREVAEKVRAMTPRSPTTARTLPDFAAMSSPSSPKPPAAGSGHAGAYRRHGERDAAGRFSKPLPPPEASE